MADRHQAALPDELAKLFIDGRTGRSLTLELPAGRVVLPNPYLTGNEAAVRPAYWLSDAPVSASLWPQLRAEHHRSGLWPLMLQAHPRDPRDPWVTGDVVPESIHDINGHDPAEFLAQVWADWIEPQEDEEELDFEDLAPFRSDWPGLAGPGEQMEDPDVVADWYAGIVDAGDARLGLAAVDRGADALAVIGWIGAANHSRPIAPLAAVVRSWEDRFGVRVILVGSDTLELSVAAPPVTTEHALRVAAEHWAFCPDNIFQNSADFSRNTLAAYAEQIREKNSWSFWWD